MAAQPTLPTACKVVVHCADQNDSMNIKLTLDGKPRNFARSTNEPLSKLLCRIRQAVTPKQSGTHRPKKNVVEGNRADSGPIAFGENLVCALFCNEGEVAETTLNRDAWAKGTTLRVGEVVFDVLFNPPTIEDISLSPRPLVGIAQRPLVGIALSVDDGACLWQWFRGTLAPQSGGAEPSCAWEEITGGNSMRYAPQPDDVGSILKVRCTPGRLSGASTRDSESTSIDFGAPAEATCLEAVALGPEPRAGHGRQHLTSSVTYSPRVRVVSYNLLAHCLSDTEERCKKLFPYVPSSAMDTEYRRQLQLEELLGFNADVICLQEVDVKIFKRYLGPQLQDEGFGGCFLKKRGQSGEGEALFFRSSRFTLAAERQLSLRECFRSPKTDPGGVHARLRPLLAHPANAALLSILTEHINTVAQIVHLAPTRSDAAVSAAAGEEGGGLVVVNTHLFYHPGASHIRMLLAAALAAEVEAAVAEWREGHGGELAVVVCGDLNSEPDTGTLELLLRGVVGPAHPEWEAHGAFTWGGAAAEEEEGGAGGKKASGGHDAEAAQRDEGAEEGGEARWMELRHGLGLASVDELGSAFTHYVRGYVGCLDYIFYQPHRMRVEQVVPLHGEELVRATALPSPRFPSDHLSLCADLCWLPPSQRRADADTDTDAERERRYPAKLWTRATLPQPATPHLLYKAVASLQRGELLALPTPAAYAIAAHPSSHSAVQRLSALLSSDNAAASLSLCVASAEAAERWVQAGALPPGLLALLLAQGVAVLLPLNPSANAAPLLTPDGRNSIAIWSPGPDPTPLTDRKSFSFSRQLAASSGGAVAMWTTRYRTTQDFRALWDKLRYVFEGGSLPSKNEEGECTVVDLTQSAQEPPRYRIARAGADVNSIEATLRKHGVCKAKEK